MARRMLKCAGWGSLFVWTLLTSQSLTGCSKDEPEACSVTQSGETVTVTCPDGSWLSIESSSSGEGAAGALGDGEGDGDGVEPGDGNGDGDGATLGTGGQEPGDGDGDAQATGGQEPGDGDEVEPVEEDDCVVVEREGEIFIECESGASAAVVETVCSTVNAPGAVFLTCGETEATILLCEEGALRCGDDGVAEECGSRGWEDRDPCPPQFECASGECIPSEGAVRLSDGLSQDNGRLEIFIGGAWGAVCDDGFDEDELAAEVACRQMGYETGTLWGNVPGPSALPIHLDEVACDGKEEGILECTHAREHDCSHAEDVAIACE